MKTAPPPPPGTPKACENPECEMPYVPTSWVQKYCTHCVGVRDRANAKSFTTKRVGRVCKHCKRNDSDTSFRTKTQCCGCYSKARINGRCEKCRRPLSKLGDDLFCVIHNPVTDPLRVAKVKFVYQGQTVSAYRSLTGKVSVNGKEMTLPSIQNQVGEVVLLVGRRDFQLRQMRNPIAVRGLQSAPWPLSLGWLPGRVLDDYYDICHFIRLGEAERMTCEWWASKFKKNLSKRNAERGWERMKKRLRDLDAPATYESDEGRSVFVVFDGPKFQDGVMREIAMRETN